MRPTIAIVAFLSLAACGGSLGGPLPDGSADSLSPRDAGATDGPRAKDARADSDATLRLCNPGLPPPGPGGTCPPGEQVCFYQDAVGCTPNPYCGTPGFGVTCSGPVDAGFDGGYGECLSDAGRIYGELKGCKKDGDCVIRMEQTDCCGSILEVGIFAASASRFDACEAAWQAHFPGCGCAPSPTTTEDGKSLPFGPDAAVPLVHCTNLTSIGGTCETYLP